MHVERYWAWPRALVDKHRTLPSLVPADLCINRPDPCARVDHSRALIVNADRGCIIDTVCLIIGFGLGALCWSPDTRVVSLSGVWRPPPAQRLDGVRAGLLSDKCELTGKRA